MKNGFKTSTHLSEDNVCRKRDHLNTTSCDTKGAKILPGNPAATLLTELSMAKPHDHVTSFCLTAQGPVKANPKLKVCQGVYFSNPKGCSTLIFGKTQSSKTKMG